MKNKLQLLPAIHELQAQSTFKQLSDKHFGMEYATTVLREVVTTIRSQIINGEWEENITSKDEMTTLILQKTECELENRLNYYLIETINATGTVLHTNLGRARLSDEAIQQVLKIARGYSNLEYNISVGTRGSRHSIVERLLMQLTGAEGAIVVNNNAAAVFFILRALAKNKEVIVSRGQLVEIGGSFRISAIMEESGAQLVEVGTTNKTHLQDYINGLSEQTSMVLKVHTSNFKTIGFTKTVELSDLITLREKKEDLIIYEDLGSGVLYDFNQHGIGDEPVIKDIIEQGVDLVSFSGDKLLGGPQAGIIVGKRELIDTLKKHQLARVLRVDKMTYAALEATLLTYERRKYADIPTIRDILTPKEEILERCQWFIDMVGDKTNDLTVEIKEDGSPIGGGTMPGIEVPTYVVCMKHSAKSAEEVSTFLRKHRVPIITRIKNDEVLFDFRTVTSADMEEVVRACELIG
ncbi:L-seryl-tRNA(Sec) selenium transferase [Ferdinandcohnia sp. Marseille-Q9671]